MTSVNNYDPYSGLTTILGGGGGINSILNAASNGQSAQDIGMQAPEQTDSVQSIIENGKTYDSIANYVKQSLLQLNAYIKSPNDHTLPPSGWLRNASYAGQNGIPIFLSSQAGKLDLQAIRIAQYATSKGGEFSQLQLPKYTAAQKKILSDAIQSLPDWYKRQDTINDKKKLTEMLSNAADQITRIQNNVLGIIDDKDPNNTLANNTTEAWQQTVAQALYGKHPFFINATLDGGTTATDQFSDEYLNQLKFGSDDYHDPVTKEVYNQQERDMLAQAIEQLKNYHPPVNPQPPAPQPKPAVNPKAVTSNTGPAGAPAPAPTPPAPAPHTVIINTGPGGTPQNPTWLDQALEYEQEGTGFALTITKDALGNPQVEAQAQNLASNITGPALSLTEDEKTPPPTKWLADAVDNYSSQMPFMFLIKNNTVETVPLIKQNAQTGLDVRDIMNMVFPRDQIEDTSVANMFSDSAAESQQMGFYI